MGEPARIGSLPRVGESIDRYEVIAEIAHGGMAAVYAVRRSSIGGFDKILAMKVLLPHLQTDRQFVDMFLDEARIASVMQHPNVVHAFDLGEQEGQPFMVMELLRGQSLNRVLKKARQETRPLPLGFYCRVLAETAAGLHAAHETRGTDGEPLHIVHRDVSPQNIHIGYDGLVKVVDFGIAAARGRISGTKSGELKGKLTYMAPEQIDRKQPINRTCDVWALGVVAWELFSGHRLFKGEDDATRLWKILNMEIPSLLDISPRIPKELAATVMACLARRQEDRPSTCHQIAEVFHAAARELKHDSNAKTADVLLDLFAAEKAVEEERLQAALRGGPPRPIVDGDPESGVTSSPSVSRVGLIQVEDDGPKKKRTGWILGASLAALAVVVGAGIVASLPGGEDPSVDATDAEHAAPPPPAAAAPAEVAPSRSVSIHVPTEARLVLVNGERRDGNPLRLRLGPDETADIEIVAPTGEIVRHTIGIEDDGRTLELPAPAAAAVTAPGGEAATREAPGAASSEPATSSARVRRGSTGSSSSMMRRALLGNPYE